MREIIAPADATALHSLTHSSPEHNNLFSIKRLASLHLRIRINSLFTSNPHSPSPLLHPV